MAKKKRYQRKRDAGEVVLVAFEIAADVAAALERAAAAERRTKRAVLSAALEEYLQRAGLWPTREGA
jgi:hypothetical protein